MESFYRYLLFFLILLLIISFFLRSSLPIGRKNKKNMKSSNINCDICNSLTNSHTKKKCLDGCYLDKCFNNCDQTDQKCKNKCMDSVKSKENTDINPYKLNNGKENYYDTDINPYKLNNGKENYYDTDINPYKLNNGKENYYDTDINPYKLNNGKENYYDTDLNPYKLTK